jgi:hypothetical protein
MSIVSSIRRRVFVLVMALPSARLSGRRQPAEDPGNYISLDALLTASGHLLIHRVARIGGTFFRIDSRALYGCGWHRDRGSSVCVNTLAIPQDELEERVLNGVMRVLTPQTRSTWWSEP